MSSTISLESEITNLLKVHGSLSVAFITRFLNEMGLDCTRQKVERTLRKMVEQKKVEAFYTNGNKRKHYRLR
ncbi:hypothetical protein FH039_02380 [Thermococcus indicus]|uniref:Transposase n=3 Tax=Thermococcus TaxID=2263 RepID=A0A100XYU1_9EURY|nr:MULTISPECIES: hypothetical protein [Thermococcus]KUH34070.1 hypothetical protein APY94_03600 [Thermococcus celericrescens]QDA30694.1 hypothetical protein FH039_02380 [Thermococcus indicus]QEK14871.1 hypothetical protein FPV09_06965 [Thermococcus aciditolerans]